MENCSHFDTAAKTWDTEETIKRNEAFAKAITKHVSNHIEKMMGFGCGTGLLTSHFINLADEVIGIETSNGMFKQLTHQSPNQQKQEVQGGLLEQMLKS